MLKAQMDEYKEQLSNLQDNFIPNLKEQNKDLQSQIIALRQSNLDDVRKKDGEISQLKANIQELQAEIVQLNGEGSGKDKQIEELKEQIEDHMRQIQELTTEKEQQIQQIQQIQTEGEDKDKPSWFRNIHRN